MSRQIASAATGIVQASSPAGPGELASRLLEAILERRGVLQDPNKEGRACRIAREKRIEFFAPTLAMNWRRARAPAYPWPLEQPARRGFGKVGHGNHIVQSEVNRSRVSAKSIRAPGIPMDFSGARACTPPEGEHRKARPGNPCCHFPYRHRNLFRRSGRTGRRIIYLLQNRGFGSGRAGPARLEKQSGSKSD
ncbi:MAG: hypothetical protein U1G05_00755 [Kiritimatiellia bacterium]